MIFFVISILIVLYGVNCYQKGNTAKAVLIFLFFMTNGFNLLSGSLLSGAPLNKFYDICILYLVLIFIHEGMSAKKLFFYDTISKILLTYAAFLTIVFVITITLKNETFGYALSVYRRYLVFFSIIFFKKLSREDLIYIFNFIVKITILVTILFVLQPVLHLKLVDGFSTSYGTDYSTLDGRLRNIPEYTYFLFFYLLANENIKNRIWYILLVFVAMCLTQHRAILLASAVCFLIFLIKKRNMRKMFTYSIAGAMAIVLSFPLISDRLSKADIVGDLMNGASIIDGGESDDDVEGTFSFRIFLLTERFLYLQKNPEYLIQGIGMCHEDSPKQSNRFNFLFCSRKTQDDVVIYQQIDTADLAWATPLLRFGLLGLSILIFWTLYIIYYFKKDKYNSISLLGYVYILFLVIISLKNSLLLADSTFFMIFMLVYMSKKQVELSDFNYKLLN